MRASDRIPFSASAEEKAWPASGSSIASALANAVQRKGKNVGAAVLIRLAGMDPDRRGGLVERVDDGRVAAVLPHLRFQDVIAAFKQLTAFIQSRLVAFQRTPIP